jgi:hypothetical protein
MARSKYDPDTFPKLAEGYARQGMRDVDIARKLGVGHDSFYKYQKRYPDFAEALKNGKAPVDFEVENKLLKRALGYEVTETQTESQTVDGKQTTKVRVIKKHIAPDVTAQIFWLKNRAPDKWRDRQDFHFDKVPKFEIEVVDGNGNSTGDAAHKDD